MDAHSLTGDDIRMHNVFIPCSVRPGIAGIRRARLTGRRDMGILTKIAIGLLVPAVLIGAASPAAADQPLSAASFAGSGISGPDSDHLQIGVGAFNVIPTNGREGMRDGDTSPEVRLEYWFGGKLWGFGPMFGILGNSDGGVFGYGGIYTDWHWGKWHITPAAGVGGYERGSSKDLGGTFQFHLGLDVAYQFDSGQRLGIKFAHISNAGIHEHNPGTESVLVTYTLPIDFF